MSISNARKFFEKSGCGHIFIILAGIAMVFSLWVGNCGDEKDNPTEFQKQIDESLTLGTIDGVAIKDYVVDLIMTSQKQQYAQYGINITPELSAGLLGGALTNAVSNALLEGMAKKYEITVSKEELNAEFEQSIDAQIGQMRSQLISQGKLKADASEEEYRNAFKQATGQEYEKVRADMISQNSKLLNEPSFILQSRQNILSKKLLAKYESSVQISDAELKAGFDTFITKRIFFDGTGDKMAAAIKKAEAALKVVKGGANFDDAINKYSEDPVPPGKKKKSDSTVDLTRSILQFDPTYKGFTSMKAGDVSGMVMTSSGPAIFKVISIAPKVPSDFEKNKKGYKDTEVRQRAFRQMQEEMTAARKEKLTWELKGAQALFEWNLANSDLDYTTDSAKRLALKKSAFKLAQEATDDNARYAVLAQFALCDELSKEVTGEELNAIKASKFEIYQKVLEVDDVGETLDLRIRLIDLALASNKKEDITRSIMGAIESIASSGGAIAEKSYESVNQKYTQAKAKGLFDSASDEPYRKAVDTWKQVAYEDLKYEAQGIIDYSAEAKTAYDNYLKKVQRFEKLGVVTAEKRSELNAELKKWLDGAFEGLKALSSDNLDYGAMGQATWSNVNGQIQTFQKMGALSASQVAELQKVQQKWVTDKKAEDARIAAEKKNQPKAQSSTSGSATGTGGGTTSGSSLFKPGGSTSGN